MSLGLTRDSVGDLVHYHDKLNGKKNEQSSLRKSHSLPQEEGRTAVISLDLENQHGTEETVPVSTESSSPYGHYSGFSVDYQEYEKYGGVTYADNESDSQSIVVHKKGSEGGFWCCLFPWLKKEEKATEPDENQAQETASNEAASTKSDDEVSTGSEAYGEKLTENERAAVLARLRLATPEMREAESAPVAESPGKMKGLLNGIPDYEPAAGEHKDQELEKGSSKNEPRSILKRGSVLIKNSSESFSGTDKAAAVENGQRRRSLFPQQYEKKPKQDKNARFAPMARVVTVKSKNEMSELEKSLIWWQKQDYEDFKKTGRLISKAMCEGGSEIWLASNNAWETAAKPQPPGISRSQSENVRALHLSDRNAIQPPDNGKIAQGDKWWHKFGHSRRGLEHIASVEEGRQRQANVRTAIRAVLDEQRRQKIYRKEDSDKLRMLSLQYTTWARDLALAAAASDAEAVQVNFDESRKSREYFLLKNAKAAGGYSKQVPSFMIPHSMNPQVLDHNTSTQIRYRRKQSRVSPIQEDTPSTTSEPIHDNTGKTNLAKKAAGFGASDADVSSILSGLGTGDENSIAAIKPQAVASVGAH